MWWRFSWSQCWRCCPRQYLWRAMMPLHARIDTHRGGSVAAAPQTKDGPASAAEHSNADVTVSFSSSWQESTNTTSCLPFRHSCSSEKKNLPSEKCPTRCRGALLGILSRSLFRRPNVQRLQLYTMTRPVKSCLCDSGTNF